MAVRKLKHWACLDMNETKHNQNTHRASGEQVCWGKPLCGFWWKRMNWMHKKPKEKEKRPRKSKFTETEAGVWKDEDDWFSLIEKSNLCENIFILHNQRVGVHMSREEVLSVAVCASLGSALHVLGPWKEAKGNQSEVIYNHLPSNSNWYALELLYSMHMLNVLQDHCSWTTLSLANCLNNEVNIQPQLLQKTVSLPN